MPDAEPTAPVVSVESKNGSTRAAVEAQSAALLKEAIAKVTEEPVQAAAEPVEAAEASPEPAGASAEEPRPVDQAAPAPKPEKVSATLERKAKETIRARNAEREAKAANERAAALEAENRELRERDQLLRSDPMGALVKVGHKPEELVPGWLKRVAEPEKTPEQLAADAQQKKIEELEAFKAQLELQQRTSATRAQIAEYQGKCAEAIADKETFEYVHRDGGTEALYNYIIDSYNLALRQYETKQISKEFLDKVANTPPAKYAKQLEMELRGKFATPKAVAAAAAAEPAAPTKRGKVDPAYTDAAQTVRGSRSIRQRQAARADDEEPRTLSARNSAVRTVPSKRSESLKELYDRAAKAMETGKFVPR